MAERNLTQLDDTMAAIARARACEPLYFESPDETRARLFFHAAHVWGNKMEVEKPHVFSLVGMHIPYRRANETEHTRLFNLHIVAPDMSRVEE